MTRQNHDRIEVELKVTEQPKSGYSGHVRYVKFEAEVTEYDGSVSSRVVTLAYGPIVDMLLKFEPESVYHVRGYWKKHGTGRLFTVTSYSGETLPCSQVQDVPLRSS